MQASTFILSAVSSLLFVCAAAADEPSEDGASWPQWHGPARNGVSTETDWTPGGKALWETEVGLGYSSVVVQDGRLYTMGYNEEFAEDLVWCLDALTGEEVWVHPYPAKIWNEAHRGGTVNTPTVEGDAVYSLNREGNLFRLDAETGEVLWHVNITEEHGVTPPRWGFSASPVVHGDRLILNAGKVLCLSQEDGALQWSSKNYGQAYATPTPLELRGKQVVAVLNGGGLGVLDAADGTELYTHGFGSGQARGVTASAPVAIDETVFVSSQPAGGGARLAFGEDEVEVLWENKTLVTGLSEAVLVDGHLYGFDNEVLKCVDVDGNEKWNRRGIGAGAVMGTPDRILVMGGDGALTVVAASPEEYNELSRAELFDTGKLWTKPILVGGVIYCRSSDGGLIARDHRSEQ